MSRHEATIAWHSDGAFASGRYSRRHEWRFDGGTVIAASSSPAVVPTPMSDAGAVDPEEALVASVASCHMLWFLALALPAGFKVDSYEDEADGEVGRIGPGRMAMTRITLRPRIGFSGPKPSPEQLAGLHHDAHERCFIANSLKTEVSVEPQD